MQQTTVPVTWLDHYFSSLYGETLVYGIYCVLFVLTLIKHSCGVTLLQRRSQLSQPEVNRRWLLLVMTVVMFVVGTGHSAISLWQTYASIRIVQGIVVREDVHLTSYEYAKLALEVVNCFMGDLIMISIALTIERRMSSTRTRICPPTSPQHMLYAIPLSFLVASVVTGVKMVLASDGRDVLSGAVNHSLRGYFISWTSLVLATNLISAIIFSYEFYHRRSQLGSVAVTSPLGPLDVLLLTLMSSSILYCCSFTILLVLFLSGSDACYILNHMMPQLAGVYPTIAVVAVAIRKDMSQSPGRKMESRPPLSSAFHDDHRRPSDTAPLKSSTKDAVDFLDPFTPGINSNIRHEGSPIIAAMGYPEPTYPATTAAGVRKILQRPWGSSSSNNILRKESESSNISSASILVTIETRVDRDYLPKEYIPPSAQSSSLSLPEVSRLYAQDALDPLETISSPSDRAERAELGQSAVRDRNELASSSTEHGPQESRRS